NEHDLFSYIKSQLGSSRLFTVGIGSAPNGFFMKRAAQAGRGTYTFISDINEVAAKSDVLFRKLETPALTDIELSVGGDGLEYYKNPIPDMYIGEPVTILLRGKNLSKTVSLKGAIGAQPWQQTVVLEQGINNEGIATAWARAKIASLSESYHDAGNEVLKTFYKNEIIDVSQTHHLVSQYTSLVAVDVTPVNQGGMLYQERLKNNLPHGWAAPGQNRQSEKTMLAQINLPRTATDAPLHLMFALVFLTLGVLLRVTRKTR
ncbi:MAG: marine proteobacterial sortase target protein, partial [Gammaproteobacteria bacterium]